MRSKKFLFPSFLILTCVHTWAKEVTDTLESLKRDKVYVTYDVKQNNGQVDIRFLDVRKQLGRSASAEYKKLKDVVVLFFDRVGNYEDDMEFSGIDVDAFMIPKEVQYKVSRDGYFLLSDNPTLSMELRSDDSAELSIPIFLAHYEGKHRYKVFSRCEDLKIKLAKKKEQQSQVQEDTISQPTVHTFTLEEEMDAEDADAEVAYYLIPMINDLLDEQKNLPFTDDLEQAISRLRGIRYQTRETKLASKIDEVLSSYKLKKDALMAAEKAAEEASISKAALEAEQAKKQAEARQDSIRAEEQKNAAAERKQNLWLIIGGVLLAILAFVGSQVSQHFRNVRNQKSMMDMQQNAMKRAENEAKRRTRSMVQSQISRVRNETRRKTNQTINDGLSKIGKKGKSNKGFSI